MSDETMIINPVFEDLSNPETIKNHVNGVSKKAEFTPHEEILDRLLEQFEPLDFQSLAFPQAAKLKKQLEAIDKDGEEANEIQKRLEKFQVNHKHYLIISIENILKVSENNHWSLCKNQEFIYLYNDAYWSYVDKESFQKFLGLACEKMNVPQFTAKHYQFREQLLKQFLSTEYFPTPEPPKDKVYINLLNGTFEVGAKETTLRRFNRADFLTYQLPFEFNPDAEAPIFHAYLNRVLPDQERQNVLSEYLGFVFIKNGSHHFKEEKALILYGSGANGKSVFFEIVNALLGIENVSSYSLSSLTDQTGYFRAMIANKLVNYASEINGKLETSIFKQIVSGEPVEARLPYGKPMLIKQYAKLIFNCNSLPKEIEHTNAYFRRFLIVPFDVTIPESDQDKRLHNKIIESELSGVFNWILQGLDRLLRNKGFSNCEAAREAVENYKIQSDTVKLFLDENNLEASSSYYRVVKELYQEYRTFCVEDGYKPVNKSNFIKRFQGFNIVVEKKNVGNVAFVDTKKEELI